jgi:hypothetical protein
MMTTYKFHATPQLIYRYPGYAVRQLSPNGILQTLAGATVHQLVGAPHTGYDVEVQLERSTHHDAMHDIRVALENLGFSVLQAEITVWLTSTAEFAVVGGTGGGAIGAATKDPVLFVLFALIGAGAGAVAAQFTKKVKERFDAQLVHRYGAAGWSITPQAPPATQGYPAPWPYPS